MPDNTHTQDDTGDFDVPTRPIPGRSGSSAQPPEESDEDALPPDHPALDTAKEEHKIYDEGTSKHTQ